MLRLRRLDVLGSDSTTSLRARLDLYERSIGAWLRTACPTPWLLSMAINSRIDGSDGTWRVNQPVEFVVVSAWMLLVTYAGLRDSRTGAARGTRFSGPRDTSGPTGNPPSHPDETPRTCEFPVQVTAQG